MKFIRVVAPHFVVGIEITNGTVTRVPPIVRWALHKSEREVLDYFRRKRYQVEELPSKVTLGGGQYA